MDGVRLRLNLAVNLVSSLSLKVDTLWMEGSLKCDLYLRFQLLNIHPNSFVRMKSN